MWAGPNQPVEGLKSKEKFPKEKGIVPPDCDKFCLSENLG